jgi:predicted transcriptional regulator
MMKLTLTTGTEKDFFTRGRDLARKLDRGEKIVAETVITFEDAEELLEVITRARIDLLRAVNEEPGSITDIARRLHRDRSAVKRDIDILASAGLVQVESRPSPGHGQKKFVKALAKKFQLTAQIG